MYSPTEEEIIEAISWAWQIELGAFNNLGVAKLLQRIKAYNPEWQLSEKRLKNVKTRGIADGRLKQPQREIGIVLQPTKEDVVARDRSYVFDKAWRSAEPPSVGELHSTFEITSGELIWGHMRGLVAGMKATKRDVLFLEPKKSIGTGTVYQAPWNNRAAAKPGDWKVSRVQRKDGDRIWVTGWIMHHVSVDPQSLVEMSKKLFYGMTHPRVSYVNRYDWGWHGHDTADVERTVADIDPEEWRDAWSRKRALWLKGRRLTEHDADKARWDRFDTHNYCCAFFCDAVGAPGLVKLLARPSELEDRVNAKVSTSVYSGSKKAPFGCYLSLPKGSEYEIARLIYGEEKSARFPEDDELVGIWYDTLYHNEDGDLDATVIPM